LYTVVCRQAQVGRASEILSVKLHERSRAFFAATTMPTPQVTRLAAATALYDKMDRDQNSAVSLEELSCSMQV
jgi:hypothetical protein